jgi:hypothetical protein
MLIQIKQFSDTMVLNWAMLMSYGRILQKIFQTFKLIHITL